MDILFVVTVCFVCVLLCEPIVREGLLLKMCCGCRSVVENADVIVV